MTKDESNENIINLSNYFKLLNIDNIYIDNLKKSIKKYHSFENKKNKSYFKSNNLLSLKRKRETKSLDNSEDKKSKNNQIPKNHDNSNIDEKKDLKPIKMDNANKNNPLIEEFIEKKKIYKTNNSDSENKNDKIKTNLNDESICLKTKDYENNKKEQEIKNESLYNENNFELKKVGFKNIGHTCYMNSFLQILLHCPEFLKKLNNYYNDDNKNIIYYLINLSIYPNNTNLLKQIKKLMGEMDESYGEYAQNDSQEFGIDLINKIILTIKKDLSSIEESENSKNEEIGLSDIVNIKLNKFDKYLKRYYPKENAIDLEDMFQFHESKIKIEDNKVIDIDFETFLNIDLVFPPDYQNKKYNLEDLLKYKYFNFSFKKEEKKVCNKNNNKKTNENKKKNYYEYYKQIKDLLSSYLPKIKNSNSHKKNIEDNNDNIQNNEIINISEKIILKKLASLPKILIISINRALLGKSLIKNSVTFRDTLNMEEFIDSEILKNACPIYKLFAVNECYGFSKKNGHYYSYIKISDKWFNFNDDKVTKEDPNFSSEFVVGLYYIKQ